MAKKSIRTLAREIPDEVYSTFELISEPEHPASSVVMLGCAVLDHLLGEALLQHLTGRVDREALLRGPLRSLSNKIVMAEATSVITPETATDLHRIRDVRNAFAHAVTPLSFETPEVVAEINGLTFFGEREAMIRGAAPPQTTPKYLFALYTYLACISFALTPAQWKEAREWVLGFALLLEDLRGIRVDSPNGPSSAE